MMVRVFVAPLGGRTVKIIESVLMVIPSTVMVVLGFSILFGAQGTPWCPGNSKTRQVLLYWRVNLVRLPR